MPEVFIDGEQVEFSGAPPGTLAEVRDLLEHAVTAQGRVLAQLVIDGAEFADERGAQSFTSVARIEAKSVELAVALRELATAVCAAVATARAEAERLGAEVLRMPWIEIQGACIELAETLGRVLQDLGGLASQAGASSTLAAAAEAAANATERWIDAVTARDAAKASVFLDDVLVPALGGVQDALTAVPPETAPASSSPS